MNKYDDMKQFDGLVWRTWNYSLFGVKPDDDDIVQQVYNMRPDGDKFVVAFSELNADGTVADDVIVCCGSREKCQQYFDARTDERVNPKMICYSSFKIGRKK